MVVELNLSFFSNVYFVIELISYISYIEAEQKLDLMPPSFFKKIEASCFAKLVLAPRDPPDG